MATFPFIAGLDRSRTWTTSGSEKYRLALLETQLVEATVRGILVMSGLTLDEPDDASYGRQEVLTRTVNIDVTTNFRAECLAAATVYPSMAGAEDIVSGVLYWDPDGSDTESQNVPIYHLALSSLITTDGNNLVIKYNNTDPGIVFYDAAS